MNTRGLSSFHSLPSRWAVCALSVSALAIAASMASAQSPIDGTVAAGAAQISQSAARTVVQQSSQRAVIDWRSFDVGRDHTVDFQQPGRTAATLNRVQSHRPSLIEGAITAPGTVVIQNTAGVTFSGTARIDAGGLLATSQIVDSDHFMESGNFRIGGGEQPGARVENAGRFAIDANGLAALVGSNVTNSGLIVADMGTVVLASGEATTIDLAGDGVFQVVVSGSPEGGQVTQSGQVEVGGGRVLLTAGGAAGMMDSVINTSGITRAVSGTGAGGQIELVGRGGGTVNIGGTLDASGATTGGRIAATGESVSVESGAQLTANGASGGEILIGGEFQGGGEMRRSQRTVLNTGAEIRADGTADAGGTIIVWSDGTTWFDALISAEGAQSGGFVETSGKEDLGTGNTADVRVGDGGQWLLDPRNVRIANSGTDVGGGINNPPDGAGTYQIRRASITNALDAGSDVTITTIQPAQAQEGNITVDSALRWNGDGDLTLLAEGSIEVNSTIDARGDGAVSLLADAAIDANSSIITRGTGDITLNAGTTIDTRNVQALGGGDINLNATGDIATAGTIDGRQGGNINIESSGAVDTGNTVRTRDAGDVSIIAGTSLTTNNVRAEGSGDVTLTAGTDITTGNRVETRGDGNVNIDAGGSVTFNREVRALGAGDLTVTAGGDLEVNRNSETRGGDLSIDVGGDIVLNRQIASRNGGSVTANADGSFFINRDMRMRGAGDMTLIAGDRIEVDRQIRRDGAGDLSLQAENDITINRNIFANDDGLSLIHI